MLGRDRASTEGQKAQSTAEEFVISDTTLLQSRSHLQHELVLMIGICRMSSIAGFRRVYLIL